LLVLFYWKLGVLYALTEFSITQKKYKIGMVPNLVFIIDSFHAFIICFLMVAWNRRSAKLIAI